MRRMINQRLRVFVCTGPVVPSEFLLMARTSEFLLQNHARLSFILIAIEPTGPSTS